MGQGPETRLYKNNRTLTLIREYFTIETNFQNYKIVRFFKLKKLKIRKKNDFFVNLIINIKCIYMMYACVINSTTKLNDDDIIVFRRSQHDERTSGIQREREKKERDVERIEPYIHHIILI